jgi:hypothetical protein
MYDNFIALKLQKKFTICIVMITGSEVIVKFTFFFIIIFF